MGFAKQSPRWESETCLICQSPTFTGTSAMSAPLPADLVQKWNGADLQQLHGKSEDGNCLGMRSMMLAACNPAELCRQS